MRRLCLYFSFLLAALVVAPNANAQDTLKLNQTYRDVIRLDFAAGKTQIPLPEGEWELLGLQEDLSTVDIRMWFVYLARVENDTLVGQVFFIINTDLWDYGWISVDYCDRDNLWFKEVKSNRESDVDCWAVTRVGIRPGRWEGGRKQMLDNLLSRNVNVTIPQKMIRAVFFRRNTDNFLSIYYYFHRYPLGRPNITREDIKTWGRKWKPKVDAGFLGKLKAFKAKETPALVKQSPKLVLGEEQRRLSRSEVRSLLLSNTEVGMLEQPSRPAVEGNSGQTYKAYYQDNNTVWYKLDAADDIKRWDWEIMETGVVCRGPEMGVQSWCRAITPDGAGGYKAVGFRTGNLRYQFRVEKGLFGLPEHLLK